MSDYISNLKHAIFLMLPTQVQRLQDAMKIEVKTFEKEESELKREVDEVSALTTLDEIQKQVGLIRKDILKEQLKVLGLHFNERTGTSPYHVAQIYMFRLELYLAVIEKAQLRSAELNPHNLTTEEVGFFHDLPPFCEIFSKKNFH